MTRKLFLRVCQTFVLALPLGCTTSTPSTPTPSSAGATIGPEGSTLKVSAPSLVSPLNGQQLSTFRPTLVLQRASGQFVAVDVSYEIQVTTVGGATIYARTIAGGVANGQGTLSHTIEQLLSSSTSYRWRARAIIGGDAGPWSNEASGAAMFITATAPTAASSNDQWRDYFFSLIAQKGVGPIASAQALAIMEPDLRAVGVILEKNSAGVIRGRIYLPTGNPSNLFARSVDIGDFGGPWQWIPRGSSVCEGICP